MKEEIEKENLTISFVKETLVVLASFICIQKDRKIGKVRAKVALHPCGSLNWLCMVLSK